MDFKHGVNNGYAFVNLPVHAHALRLMDTFQGFSGWLPALRSKKVCETTWARPTQGLEANVERYHNSSVMHTSTPEAYKPMIFKNGVRVTFPPPTKNLSAPVLPRA